MNMYTNELEDAIYEAYESDEINTYAKDYLLDVLEEKVTNKQKNREKNFKKRHDYNEKDNTYDTGEKDKDGKPIRRKLYIGGSNTNVIGPHMALSDNSIHISKRDIRSKPMSSDYLLKHEEGHTMVRDDKITADSSKKLNEYMADAEKYINDMKSSTNKLNAHDSDPEEMAVDTYSANKLKKMYPGKDVARACNYNQDMGFQKKYVKRAFSNPEHNNICRIGSGRSLAQIFNDYKKLINEAQKVIDFEKNNIKNAKTDVEKAKSVANIKVQIANIEKIIKKIESTRKIVTNSKTLAKQKAIVLDRLDEIIEQCRQSTAVGFAARRAFVRKELEKHKNVKESVYDNIILAYEYGEIDEYDRDYLLESLDQAIYERNIENKIKKKNWERRLDRPDGDISDRRGNRDIISINKREHMKDGSTCSISRNYIGNKNNIESNSYEIHGEDGKYHGYGVEERRPNKRSADIKHYNYDISDGDYDDDDTDRELHHNLKSRRIKGR